MKWGVGELNALVGHGWAWLREARQRLLSASQDAPETSTGEQVFHDVELGRRPSTRALLGSASLHVLLVVTPLPAFLTAPTARMAPETFRVEYDLESLTQRLPAVSPQRRASKRLPWPKARKKAPARAQSYNPQVIISHPLQANHPRQTLLSRFRAESARLREVRLPNIVLPPAPDPQPQPLRGVAAASDPSAGLRPASPGEIRLAATRLENLLPRLVVPARGNSPVSAPEVGDAPSSSAGLPGGLVALSADPAEPTLPLEIPRARLRARFTAGPAVGSGGGGEDGEGGLPAAIHAPHLLVNGGTGGLTSGGAILGPAPPPATPPMAALRQSEARSPEAAKSPAERGRELFDAVQAGTPPPEIYFTYVTIENLTSQSSTWFLHFTERAANSPRGAPAQNSASTIAPPRALRKVDPCYPGDASRERVEGSVVLYAVIRADGGVENVTVMRGITPRIDQSAAEALANSRFAPARKNGQPIAVEAILEIPFRLAPCL